MRVHPRLRVGRLIALVVAVAAVAHQVDEDIGLEPGPVVHGEPDHGQARLRVVGVHVEDGDVEAPGQVAGVLGGPALARVGGEADLVVHDDVERPAGLVAGEARDVQRLRHDALAGEGRVAVHEDGEDPEHVLGTRRVPSRSVCFARAIPSTTGFTNSRWLGFGAMVTVSGSPETVA
jgi:hypothetical protein